MVQSPSEHPPARHPAFQPLRGGPIVLRDGVTAQRDGASALSYATRFQQTWQEKHGHRWLVHRGLYYPASTKIEEIERGANRGRGGYR
jgi:hypothetical protein